ncbi:exo-alpha-sialidase [Candidatus Acetothermia bacterium]|nr:exo-alpha-sialidase [Candidatus Acetothermia bacterium]
MMNNPSATSRVLLMVGTQKGAFTLTSDSARKKWSLAGPDHIGSEIYHMAYDPRDGGRLLAAVNHAVWGPHIQVSRDLGKSWVKLKEQPRFPEGGKEAIKHLWHIKPGRESEPGVWYVGAEPASLFKTENYGESWSEVKSLSSHPTRDRWQPGFGGLCLHSIVLHPADKNKMWIGISAVGVFGTSDGGKSWKTMNKGVRADFQPEKLPEFGQCVHKLLMHPQSPETLFQQNHCGVYRSDSGGAEWKDISAGLPSRFGFVLGLHSQEPKTLYVVPEDKALGEDVGGGRRYVTDAQFRVYRSRSAGKDWEVLSEGLPQKNAYMHLLREGMATDTLKPCGIYMGTKTGQVYYSRNDGDQWELLQEYLPPVLSVGVAVI